MKIFNNHYLSLFLCVFLILPVLSEKFLVAESPDPEPVHSGPVSFPTGTDQPSTTECPTIAITNYTDGDEQNYPVALLRGTVSDVHGKYLIVENLSSDRSSRIMRTTVYKGQFKILVELVPGVNYLILSLGKARLEFVLHYKKSQNPYIVRAILLESRPDPGRQNVSQYPADSPPTSEESIADTIARLQTALLLMQTMTAERFHDAGYGRRTFSLEFDSEGQIIVHHLQLPDTAIDYQNMPPVQLYQFVERQIQNQMPALKAKNLAIANFIRIPQKDREKMGQVALGGGNLALMDAKGLFCWPRTLNEVEDVFRDSEPVDAELFGRDSAYRNTRWGVAATTMGAALHELGHAFGLNHTPDPNDIMNRGFDHFNRVFLIVESPSAQNRQEVYFTREQESTFSPESIKTLLRSHWFQ